MKRIARVVGVGIASLGLVVNATPAHAAAYVLFTGSATTPATFAPGFGPAANGTWTFTASGTAVSIPGGIGGASLNVSGQYHTGMVNIQPGAYCGASGGSDGAGTVTTGSDTRDVVNVGWIQSVGGLIIFTGHTKRAGVVTGAVFGVAYASGGFPCISTGATNFTVIGWAVLTD